VTPLYDTLPLEAVVGRCVVLDPITYCKGRPKLPRYDESDVYVCELRVDKNQRIFDKLGKSKAAKAQAM
jgi:histone-lysine N-methyltransferase ASH1L